MVGQLSRSFADTGSNDDAPTLLLLSRLVCCHWRERTVFQISKDSGRNARNNDRNVHPSDLCGRRVHVERSIIGSNIGRIGPK